MTSGGATGRVARFDLATGAELPALDDHSTVDLGVSGGGDGSGRRVVRRWHRLPTGDLQAHRRRRGPGFRDHRPGAARHAAERSPSAPAVGDGVAVTAGGDGLLRAYDSAGVQGCTPIASQPGVVECTELWTAPVGTVVGTPSSTTAPSSSSPRRRS